ncbi:MAG: chemotaxis protein CheW [Bryobacteraceae bacterium]
MEDQEIVNEFLIESSENLSRLDQEMVELEQRPGDGQLLASIFRTIHTIKGTCGFLGFHTLESITHHAENLLSQVRNGERPLTAELVSLVLQTVDATKQELLSIEQTGHESGNEHADLRARLQVACEAVASEPGASEPGASEPVGSEAVACEAVRSEAAASAEMPAPASAPAGPESVAPAPVATPPTPAATPPVSSTSNAQPEARSPEPPKTPPADSPAETEPQAGSRGPSVADATIRVDIGLLDKLMNLVGELVLARNQILQFSGRLEDTQFNATTQRLNLITTQLQEGVMKTRMQPIGVVWNKLPRVVRDLASACGKQIQLEMDGADTELDKSIIEAIKDPLTHIVRNCCDHGIEAPDVRAGRGKPVSGTLSLRAFHEGGQVIIEIHDDGGGIDPEKVKARALQKGVLRPEQVERMSEREALHLIFAPGFSTAEKVTNISGRGVGMDVVKTNIEKIGGSVDLQSKVGDGTTVKLKIPLTLAIIPGLVVASGGERFVIPQVSLLELLRLEGEAGRKMIESIHGSPVYRRRGSLLPIAYLNEVLRLPGKARSADDDVVNIVVLQAEDRQFGLVVDAISDTQEIVVKPLGKQLKGLTCYAGATIMGDGRVALILDVVGIGMRSGVLTEHRGSMTSRDTQEDRMGESKQTVLLFQTGSHERLAVPLSLVARLEEFPRSRIEQAAGRSVVQYRGHILPLITFGETYGGYPAQSAGETEGPLQAIVFSEGERQVGLLVDRILDIVEDHVSVRTQSHQTGLLGSAVVEGKVTDFIDLPGILAQHGDGLLAGGSTPGRRLSVLVVDRSPFGRGVVRSYLDMAGHRCVEAGTESDAYTLAAKERPDAVFISGELIAGGKGPQFLDRLKQNPATRNTAVIALTDSGAELTGPATDRVAGWLSRFDREGMLSSLDRLAEAVAMPAEAERRTSIAR